MDGLGAGAIVKSLWCGYAYLLGEETDGAFPAEIINAPEVPVEARTCELMREDLTEAHGWRMIKPAGMAD